MKLKFSVTANNETSATSTEEFEEMFLDEAMDVTFTYEPKSNSITLVATNLADLGEALLVVHDDDARAALYDLELVTVEVA